MIKSSLLVGILFLSSLAFAKNEPSEVTSELCHLSDIDVIANRNLEDYLLYILENQNVSILPDTLEIKKIPSFNAPAFSIQFKTRAGNLIILQSILNGLTVIDGVVYNDFANVVIDRSAEGNIRGRTCVQNVYPLQDVYFYNKTLNRRTTISTNFLNWVLIETLQ